MNNLSIHQLKRLISKTKDEGTIYITLYTFNKRTRELLNVGKALGLLEFEEITPVNGNRFAKVELTDEYKKLLELRRIKRLNFD